MAFPGGAQIAVIRHGPNVPLPVMQLDFLNNTSLNSRITFSRGTNATLVDSTGRVTYAPANMITNSVGPASSTGVTASTATGAAPDDTNAVRLTKTDATSPRYANWNAPFTAQSNTRYVASAYFKYDGYDTTVSLEYNNVVHWGGTAWVAPFNVTASGITTDVPTNCTSGVQAIGNGWFRVWAAFTTGTVSSAVTSILTRITGASGVTVLTAWGQIEAVTYQTTPSTYNATTASAYYGPRFDYDPVTLAPRGLLIEEARTNLLTYSADWTNAAWTKTEATVSGNTTLALDGTIAADTLIGSTNNTAKFTAQTGLASTTGTFTVYAKAAGETVISLWLVGATVGASFTLTGSGSTTLLGATSSSITPAGNGWFRCTVQHNAATTTAHIYLRTGTSYIGDGTSGIYLWGAQLEAGAFATSYIPTVASTVSRSADIATMTGTNFSTWYNQSEGTFVVASAPYSAGNFTSASATDGSTNNRVQVTSSNTIQFLVGTGGVVQAILDAGTVNGGATNLTAGAYRVNDFAASINGSAVATDTSGTIPTVTRLDVGNLSGFAEFLNGHIRSIAYYNTRLPNTQLQTLTAPSLAAPLALDFISPTYTVGY
jgi:hypothetical protein